jgi:hypothetical protein
MTKHPKRDAATAKAEPVKKPAGVRLRRGGEP